MQGDDGETSITRASRLSPEALSPWGRATGRVMRAVVMHLLHLVLSGSCVTTIDSVRSPCRILDKDELPMTIDQDCSRLQSVIWSTRGSNATEPRLLALVGMKKRVTERSAARNLQSNLCNYYVLLAWLSPA